MPRIQSQVCELLPPPCVSLVRGGSVPAGSRAKRTGGSVLGKGTFGQVERRVIAGQTVDVKVFHADTCDCALQEVAASAALGPHPCVLQLLDVFVERGEVQLVYPLWELDLGRFLAKRAAQPLARGAEEESTHIFSGVLAGTEHMHRHGLLHSDIKAANVLVKGGDWIGCPEPDENENLHLFGRRLLRLPGRMQVCLADLGSSLAGQPSDRGSDSAGYPVTTLNYRAPDLALGEASFSFPIDCWSVGCLIAEVLRRTPLFAVTGGEIGL